jgi:hypothetical protein
MSNTDHIQKPGVNRDARRKQFLLSIRYQPCYSYIVSNMNPDTPLTAMLLVYNTYWFLEGIT